MTGYNTDYDGFSYLIDVSGISAENKKCLVLGSGGASLTVIAVLKDKKRAKLSIFHAREKTITKISTDILTRT